MSILNAHKFFWTLTSLIGSFSILIFVIWWFGLHNLIKSVGLLLDTVTVSQIMAIILNSFSVWALRSLRLSLFIKDLSVNLSMRICALHNLCNRILPFRTGELSLAILLNQHQKLTLSEGGLMTIWLRLLEVAALVPFISLALLFHPSSTEQLPWLSSSILVPCFLLSLISLWSIRPLLSLSFNSLSKVLYYFDKKDLAQQLRDVLNVSHQLSIKQVVYGALITLLILASQSVLFFQILGLAEADITLAETAIGSVAVHIAGIIPAPTVGNIGAHEAGWILIFQQLGQPATVAFFSAVLSQWITLGLAIFWWFISRTPKTI